MRVALDTNRLTDFFRQDLALAHFLSTCEEVWIPLIVYGEIKAGFHGGTRLADNEAQLAAFLSESGVDLLLPNRETAEFYARIVAQVKRAGTPLPDNDIWIAALALQHDLILITRDRHFEKIPQLLCR